MINKMELKFLASLSNEALARQAIITFIAPLNPSLEVIGELKTIISEAVSNAIIHGYNFDASKEVFIKANYSDNELEITITDYGVGIKDIEEAKRPHFTTRPDLEHAGMGLNIIDTLSDSMSIRSVEGMGTKLIIKKKVKEEEISYGREFQD